MRKPIGRFALIAIIFVFIAGCATFGQAVDTPEKRALAILKTWNAQFDDTMALAKQCQLGNCSEEQKDLVAKKKKWLKITDPLVEIYVNKVISGENIPDTIERAIQKLINQLIAGVEPTANTEDYVNSLINKLVSEVE